MFRPLVLAAWVALAAWPAAAKPVVKTTTQYYDVTGGDGIALLRSIDRSGPRHGFFGRAVAQTRYTVDLAIDWARKDGRCRVRDVGLTLSITYVLPRAPKALDARTGVRWTSFIAGVEKHEHTHGRLAREMAVEAEKTLRAAPPVKAASCRALDGAMKKRFRAVYDRYEERQIAFDEREHRPGGPVDLLLRALTKK